MIATALALFSSISPNIAMMGGGGIVAILAFMGFQLHKAKQAGRDEQIAKEADSYAKHIQAISDAADARPRVPIDHDPNNRDT